MNMGFPDCEMTPKRCNRQMLLQSQSSASTSPSPSLSVPSLQLPQHGPSTSTTWLQCASSLQESDVHASSSSHGEPEWLLQLPSPSQLSVPLQKRPSSHGKLWGAPKQI